MQQPYQSIDDKMVRFVSTQQPTGTCVVLTTPSFFNGATQLPLGMIIKVGDWCQGILRTSAHDFFASRWWKYQGQWQKLLNIGPEHTTDGGMDEVIQWMSRDSNNRAADVPTWQGIKFVRSDVFDA